MPVQTLTALPDALLEVVHVGPDHRAGGGMATVERRLLEAPPADVRPSFIATHRPGGAVARLCVFAGGLARLLAWCFRRTAGVVHVHVTVRGSMHRKAVCVALARVARRPVVLHVHAGPGDLTAFRARIGPLRAEAFRRMLRGADHVLSVSAASARVLEERYRAGPVEVLSNPAPDVRDEGDSAREAPHGRPVEILYLGGFANPVKGGAQLLAAAHAVSAAHPGVRVLLAGPGDPPSLDGTDGLEWLGWLDDAARDVRLGAVDAFVLPSTSEGLPMALLEAMARGKAIVATTVGGVPDVLEDGRDALLVPPGDTAALTDALSRIATSSTLRRALGAGARERARELSIERVNSRLSAIYRALAGRDRGAGGGFDGR